MSVCTYLVGPSMSASSATSTIEAKKEPENLFEHMESLFSKPTLRREPYWSTILRTAREKQSSVKLADIRENFRKIYFDLLMSRDLVRLVNDIDEMTAKLDKALVNPIMQELFYSKEVTDLYAPRPLDETDRLPEDLFVSVRHELTLERYHTALAFANMICSPLARTHALGHIALLHAVAERPKDAVMVAKMIPDSSETDRHLHSVCIALLTYGFRDRPELEALKSRIQNQKHREELAFMINNKIAMGS